MDWEMFTPIVVTLAAVAIFLAIVVSISSLVDSNTCNQFGSRSNREVKFQRYNYLSWDCLTPSQDGKWISTDALRDMVD